MPEIPEHLLKRSAERRKQLGLPTGDEGDAPAEAAAAAPDDTAPAEVAAEAPAAAAASDAGAITESQGGVPAHLLRALAAPQGRARGRRRRRTRGGSGRRRYRNRG